MDESEIESLVAYIDDTWSIDISEENLVNYAVHPRVEIRSAIARKSSIPSVLLDYLSNDKEIDVLLSLSTNEKLPRKVIEKLSKHDDWRVRKNIVENENTPEDILSVLYNDSNYERHIPKSVIDYVCQHKDDDVVIGLLEICKRDIPVKILTRLVNSINDETRYIALQYIKNNEELLEKLSTDTNDRIRLTALIYLEKLSTDRR